MSGPDVHLSAEQEAKVRVVLRKPYILRDEADITTLLQLMSKMDFLKLHVIDELQARELCRSLVLETFLENQPVFTQGAHGDKFYVVLTGECAVNMCGTGAEITAQKNKELFKCGPGKSFGERALKFDEPRSATVLATCRTELLSVTKLAYHKIMGLEQMSPSRQVSLLSALDQEEAAAAAEVPPSPDALPWKEKPLSVEDAFGNPMELSMWDKLQQTAIHAHHTDQLRHYFEEECTAGRPLNRRVSQNVMNLGGASGSAGSSVIPSFTPLEPKRPHSYSELKMSLSYSLSNMVGHERPGSRCPTTSSGSTRGCVDLASALSLQSTGPASCSVSVAGSTDSGRIEPFSPIATRAGSKMSPTGSLASSGRPGTSSARFGQELGDAGRTPGRPGTSSLAAHTGPLEPLLRAGGGSMSLGSIASPIAPIPIVGAGGSPITPTGRGHSKLRRNPYVEPRLRPDIEEYRLRLIESEKKMRAVAAVTIREKVLQLPQMHGCTLIEARDRYRSLSGSDGLVSPISTTGGRGRRKGKVLGADQEVASTASGSTAPVDPPKKVTKLKNL